jgi:hypothetical protein
MAHVGPRPRLGALLRAGIAGTSALGAFERLEWLVLGEKPVYAPERIARRWLGSDRLAPVLRFSYGPALGMLLGLLEAPPFLFAAGVAAAELLFLPAIGATPARRRWPRAQIAMLFAHTAVFSLATAAALRHDAFSASRKAFAV